uniref:Serine-threonine/tyrosine-protein kinase catalytic domain-containing protein n=1 Tax=Acanthochromis polyacanthus TaxID=80966 RepID=A0A3Q1G378_9TELE
MRASPWTPPAPTLPSTLPTPTSPSVCPHLSSLHLSSLHLSSPPSSSPESFLFLHSKDLLHGNLRARSVLVSRGFTMFCLTAACFLFLSPSRWSLGVLLYEMASLGESISVNELLQFHQRGKTLKKPSNCSNALYAVIKGCCQWKDQDRPTLAEVGRKLASAEKSASDKVLKAGGPVNIERYLQEAGYGETNSYTVF